VYKILLESAAEKDLGRLSHDIHDRVIEAIKTLAHNPRPAGNFPGQKTTGASAWAIIA
jgi:mRNA-degrading endonuclease RelE of RelBE toxin-antitoxin system